MMRVVGMPQLREREFVKGVLEATSRMDLAKKIYLTELVGGTDVIQDQFNKRLKVLEEKERELRSQGKTLSDQDQLFLDRLRMARDPNKPGKFLITMDSAPGLFDALDVEGRMTALATYIKKIAPDATTNAVAFKKALESIDLDPAQFEAPMAKFIKFQETEAKLQTQLEAARAAKDSVAVEMLTKQLTELRGETDKNKDEMLAAEANRLVEEARLRANEKKTLEDAIGEKFMGGLMWFYGQLDSLMMSLFGGDIDTEALKTAQKISSEISSLDSSIKTLEKDTAFEGEELNKALEELNSGTTSEDRKKVLQKVVDQYSTSYGAKRLKIDEAKGTLKQLETEKDKFVGLAEDKNKPSRENVELVNKLLGKSRELFGKSAQDKEDSKSVITTQTEKSLDLPMENLKADLIGALASAKEIGGISNLGNNVEQHIGSLVSIAVDGVAPSEKEDVKKMFDEMAKQLSGPAKEALEKIFRTLLKTEVTANK
jgi:hypothetical protein